MKLRPGTPSCRPEAPARGPGAGVCPEPFEGSASTTPRDEATLMPVCGPPQAVGI